MMRNLYSRVLSFLRDEAGVTSIEYVMLASLIAVIILAAVAELGDQVCIRFKAIAEGLGGTTTCP